MSADCPVVKGKNGIQLKILLPKSADSQIELAWQYKYNAYRTSIGIAMSIAVQGKECYTKRAGGATTRIHHNERRMIEQKGTFMMEKGNYEVVRFLDWEIVKLIPHVEKYATGERAVFRHWHTGIEILYFLGGESRLWINGREIHIKEEGIALVNSNEPHQLIRYETQQASGCTIIISYEYMKQLYKGIDQCSFILDEKNPSYERLKWQMRELLSVYQRRSRNQFYHIKLNNVVNEIIYLLLTDFRIENGKLHTQKYEERYRLIIQFIEQHYKENLKMEQLAGQFGFSKEYFSRSFKKYMNINFKDYLTKRRLLEAEHLLRETDWQISDVALECGFMDIKMFYCAFKKEYGSTPSTYRKGKSM